MRGQRFREELPVSRVWYCATCGYEVDRGGRCHNCKELLVESPLPELESEESNGTDADTELGYRLTDWDDRDRGRLIEVLIEAEILHRFEGDELVVGADDEATVDALVADIGQGVGDDDDVDDNLGEADEATVEALESLLHAARRLRIDPTDMAADGELAESGAEIFAIDHAYGVDGETWAAIGRVTRRLLAALGADIALEDEISGQAAVLCRLVEPIVSPQDGDTTPWRVAQTARMVTTYHPPVDVVEGSEGSEGEEGSEAGEDGGDGDTEDRHEVVYDLADWLPEERAQIDLLLERDGIAHGWEGTDIVVSEDDWDAVDALCAEVGRPDVGPLEPVDDPDADDEDGYQALSELFGAADRLAGDPEDKVKRQAFVDAAAAVTEAPVPFGMSDDQWWRIKSRVRSLNDSLDVGAGAIVIKDSATTLSDLLRGFV
jgi:hypothetical protein